MKLNRENSTDQSGAALASILKSNGAITSEIGIDQLGTIFGMFPDDAITAVLRNVNLDLSDLSTTEKFLSTAVEATGLYFKDNFRNRIAELLRNDEKLHQDVSLLITNKRLDQIEKNFGKASTDEQARLFPILDRARREVNLGSEITAETIADLTSFIYETKVLGGDKGIRAALKRELKKISYRQGESDDDVESISFKGYVSKNAASFFAKTTAGICTAGDVSLWNRSDHFHINLVTNEQIIGNIQGYTINYQGRKALLFRGFNPSVSFVGRGNVKAVSEGMINIVKQFAAENEIDEVFIPEQLNWHALTNRTSEGVYEELKRKYISDENMVPYDFEIKDKEFIHKMYRI